MANPQKGEVALVAGDVIWRLALTFNAMCELEERYDLGIEAIFEDAETHPLRASRRIVWAALQEHHATEAPDEKAAGRIIEAAGLPAVFKAVQQIAALTVEEADAEPAGGKGLRAAS